MIAAGAAQVVIGLDVGTTGVKAVAFGVDTPWRQVAIREYPLLEPAPGQAVQDPTVVLDAVAAALAECVAAVAPAEVLAVSVSAAMHGLLALDAARRPLTPLITWADARAGDQAWALRSTGRAQDLHALTGAPVHPMTPLTKLRWFAEHDPATMRAARWWAGLKDYVLLWLTGELVTELSSASGTGLLDLAARTWSPVALEVAGVGADRLPPILATTATRPLAPGAAARIGLPAGTPVVLGAADGPLGNLGTGATAPGVASLSLGTSGAVRMVVAEPQVDGDRTLFCYALTDAMWVVGGAISNGGIVVRWAREALAPDVGGDAAILELAAAVPAGSEGLVMLPHLLAERAPLWDPDLPGAYLGLRRRHTRAHLVRAAVEGVCRQMRLLLDRLDDVSAVRAVRVTGGVFGAALWRDVMAAALARPIHVVGDADGTALGAAALGLFALGLSPAPERAAAALAGPDATPPVMPDPALVAAYDETRAAIPALIAALDPVAALFGGPAR
ncbi:MAG: gluconokinase [Solirubrobacteraceae bacterium]